METDTQTLERLRVAAAKGVFVLTGAGLSAESGIPTFRDMGGLWEQYRLEDVASPEAWDADRELVTRFYNQRRLKLAEVEANPGHFALARLERELAHVTLVTQNIDDLLERAGCERVFHMHGELRKVRCTDCGHVQAESGEIDLEGSRCAACGSAPLRPHVVWFGEVPFHLDDVIPEGLASAGLFLSIGTSGVVYPAAGLVRYARELGLLTAEVNLEPSENTHMFDVQIRGRSGACLPDFVESLVG